MRLRTPILAAAALAVLVPHVVEAQSARTLGRAAASAAGGAAGAAEDVGRAVGRSLDNVDISGSVRRAVPNGVVDDAASGARRSIDAPNFGGSVSGRGLANDVPSAPSSRTLSRSSSDMDIELPVNSRVSRQTNARPAGEGYDRLPDNPYDSPSSALRSGNQYDSAGSALRSGNQYDSAGRALDSGSYGRVDMNGGYVSARPATRNVARQYDSVGTPLSDIPAQSPGFLKRNRYTIATVTGIGSAAAAVGVGAGAADIGGAFDGGESKLIGAYETSKETIEGWFQ